MSRSTFCSLQSQTFIREWPHWRMAQNKTWVMKTFVFSCIVFSPKSRKHLRHVILNLLFSALYLKTYDGAAPVAISTESPATESMEETTTTKVTPVQGMAWYKTVCHCGGFCIMWHLNINFPFDRDFHTTDGAKDKQTSSLLNSKPLEEKCSHKMPNQGVPAWCQFCERWALLRLRS